LGAPAALPRARDSGFLVITMDPGSART